MCRRIQVVIVDDDPRLRESWAKLVRAQRDMTLVASLPSANRLPGEMPEGDSVVLLDLAMPGRDSLKVMAELRDTHPQYRIIIYSGYSDSQTMRDAIASGAWGFVDKLTPPQEILKVIRRVAQGEAVFPVGFAD